MDFGLSPDQEMLRESARDFLARECPPSRVRETVESAEGRSEALDHRMAEMGWNGVLVPEAFGGLGLGHLDTAVLLTELGAAVVPGPFLFSSVLAVSALFRGGSTKQKKEWLPAIASGERIATLGWLEESDRLDADGVQASARRIRSGFSLRGRKLFVPYAPHADLWITPFRTERGNGARGITLFLVRPQTAGIAIRALDTIDRTRRVFEVEFRDAKVSEDDVLGRPGAGWRVLESILDLGAVALAADSLGGADRMLQMAVEYSRTREQFGRSIGSFQAIKHMAAEMVSEVEPARALLWYAAYALDSLPREASRAASLAKACLSDVYSRCANRAVQIHGGIGFTWEHDIHFWFKRAKWNELAFGDATFHRSRIATLGHY